MANEKHIIVDRRQKRFYHGMDEQWKDPLGVEKARKEKARSILFDKNGDGIIDKYIAQGHDHNDLMGCKVYAIKDDKSRVFEGWVRDVYPGRFLLLRNGENRYVVTFDSVIAMEARDVRERRETT